MDRLVFPLDVNKIEEALRFTELLDGYVGVFKIGLELFSSYGPEAVCRIKEKAKRSKILLDLKLHDIPVTVERTLRVLESLEVDFVTLHIEPNYNFESKVRLIGITVLTSLGDEELKIAGYNLSSRDLAKKKAIIAKNLGFSGVVCSGFEVKEIREVVGRDMIIFVPGIRPSWWMKRDDQKRVVTPKKAVENGADYIIVGRPIRNSEDPIKAVKLIEEELK